MVLFKDPLEVNFYVKINNAAFIEAFRFVFVALSRGVLGIQDHQWKTAIKSPSC